MRRSKTSYRTMLPGRIAKAMINMSAIVDPSAPDLRALILERIGKGSFTNLTLMLESSFAMRTVASTS